MTAQETNNGPCWIAINYAVLTTLVFRAGMQTESAEARPSEDQMTCFTSLISDRLRRWIRKVDRPGTNLITFNRT
jgi:hypothetical protein